MNRRPLQSEATALTTESQPPPRHSLSLIRELREAHLKAFGSKIGKLFTNSEVDLNELSLHLQLSFSFN